MSNSANTICFEKTKYVIYEPYRGLHLAYHAKKFCLSARSKYQQIDIIDNDAYGRMLFLDHNLQHTEYDAEIFNQSLCGRVKQSKARRVVVLGGGSGQTVRALTQSKSLEHITVVEIDPLLIEVCKRYVVGVRRALDDPRVEVEIGDAFSYLHSTQERFDAAVIDLTEKPFKIRKELITLRRVYSDIAERCYGRCSQYVGSAVGLAQGQRLRSIALNLSTKILSHVKVEDVFIPSFGAPHTFIHAGYEQ